MKNLFLFAFLILAGKVFPVVTFQNFTLSSVGGNQFYVFYDSDFEAQGCNTAVSIDLNFAQDSNYGFLNDTNGIKVGPVDGGFNRYRVLINLGPCSACISQRFFHCQGFLTGSNCQEFSLDNILYFPVTHIESGQVQSGTVKSGLISSGLIQ